MNELIKNKIYKKTMIDLMNREAQPAQFQNTILAPLIFAENK